MTPNSTLIRRLAPAGAVLALVAIALPARAQEEGLRELERTREVAPRDEMPSLGTRFTTLNPERELDLGFARLHAYLEERVVYDDNVFLAEDGARSDTIALTTPGFQSRSYFGDHRLTLAYSPTRRSYLHRSELDVWDHLADADLRLDFLDAYVRVGDTFQRTQETRDIRFTGKVQRELNDLHAEAGVVNGYLGVGVRAAHSTRSYGREVPRFEDLTEDSVGVFARYSASSDHAWLAEYAVLFRDFPERVINDSVTHTVLGGLEFSPREGLRFVAKAGPTWVEADHDGSIDDSSDYFGLAAEASAAVDLQPDVTARLWYVKRPEFATFSNYQSTHRGGLELSWDADPGWLTVRGQVFYEHANPSNQETLELFGAGVALDADVNRWCKVGLGYERRRRLGAGDLDYEVNQVFLQAVVYF